MQQAGTNYDLRVMNPDGTDQMPIVPADARSPAWCSDGKGITLVRYQDGSDEIYRVNADGSDLRRLTNHGATDTAPSFTPDCTKIIFSSNRAATVHNFELFLMNAEDGSDVTQLTFHPNGPYQFSEFNARYSPDGTRIAFWSDKDTNGKWDIYVMNADASGVVQLYPNFVDDYEPDWSPDGSRIVFWSGIGNSHHVHTIKPDGTDRQQLTFGAVDDVQAVFSPDGLQVAFSSNRPGPYSICFVSSSGGEPSCPAPAPAGTAAYEPEWQPVEETIEVTIDVKPGGFPNSVNPRSNGVIPVAILTTSGFDATSVDALSVRFGPASASESHGRGHIADVDGDGDLDLVLHFGTQATGITCGTTTVTLTGETTDGRPIAGSDSVKTSGCK